MFCSDTDVVLQPMKLSKWAKLNGIHYQTARKMFKEGRIPYKTEQVSERVSLVYVPVPESNAVALYARVSSQDQKQDLDRQVARLSSFAADQGFAVKEVITEIGSGMNEKRPKLNKLLKNPEIVKIVVEHKDRLGRMNVELVRSALMASGRDIVVVDNTELTDDLVADMIDVLTSFCARLYGKRGAANRARKALECAGGD